VNTPDLARLYAEHGDAVRSVLLRFVGPADVDDLAQEVFLKAGRALQRFRGDADPRTWLHRIARNTALDHLRSRGHRERMKTEPLAVPASDEPVAPALYEAPRAPANAQRSDMNRCIADYVRQLRPEYGEVLRLRDLEGLTNAEIAATLGITLETTKIRLHRARTALRRVLEGGCEFYRNDDGVLSCDVSRTCISAAADLVQGGVAECRSTTLAAEPAKNLQQHHVH
jgi:RNA polymerase sigma-70 factor (ECF subfamily)